MTRYRGGWKDYQMGLWRSCGQHLTPDKGKKKKKERENVLSNDRVSIL